MAQNASHKIQWTDESQTISIKKKCPKKTNNKTKPKQTGKNQQPRSCNKNATRMVGFRMKLPNTAGISCLKEDTNIIPFPLSIFLKQHVKKCWKKSSITAKKKQTIIQLAGLWIVADKCSIRRASSPKSFHTKSTKYSRNNKKRLKETFLLKVNDCTGRLWSPSLQLCKAWLCTSLSNLL